MILASHILIVLAIVYLSGKILMGVVKFGLKLAILGAAVKVAKKL